VNDEVDQVTDVRYGHWRDHGGQEVNKHDESHRKATETAQLIEKDEFRQIMDRRIDPSPPLRQEHLRGVRCDCFSMGISNEFRLVCGKMLEDQRGEVPIFAKVQEVLEVEGVDAVLGVVIDNLVRDEEGFMCVGSS